MKPGTMANKNVKMHLPMLSSLEYGFYSTEFWGTTALREKKRERKREKAREREREMKKNCWNYL